MDDRALYAICHNIRSLYNVGSIFRTADGAGVSRLYLGGYTGHPPRREISKTALGAEQSVEWDHQRQTWRLLERLRREGIHVVALENNLDRPGRSIFQFEPRFPLALVVGNEVTGLSKAMLRRCDASVEIPMHGLKGSLNVAVAFGIAVYQLNRHRGRTYSDSA